MPTANHMIDAKKLYNEKADYVIMPHFLGGDYIANLLKESNFSKSSIAKERKAQINQIKERESTGGHSEKGYQGK